MSVTLLTDKDLHWSFTDGASYRIGTGWGTQIKVNPAPGYTHNQKTVEDELGKMKEFFPVDSKLFIGSHDAEGHTNGFAQHHGYYDYDKPDEGKDYSYRQEYLIFLAGKPTAIHPATTPYMVAHEFGHNLEYWLSDQWGCGKDKVSSLLDVYAKVRGIPKTTYYGPGTWHLSPTEVFANDFRTFIAGVDIGFWPHKVAPLTETSYSTLPKWWRAVQQDPSKDRWEELNELAKAIVNV